MDTEYHKPKLSKRGKPPQRYRGAPYVKPIDAAKEAVPVIDLADRLTGPCGLRRRGSEWVGRCPLPDHEDKTPSFSVETNKNVWYCHGCHRGGDVVKLAQLAWGFSERESHIAAAELLLEFGHELPQRPPSYFRKQERQKKMREALDEVRIQRVRRRLMRLEMQFITKTEDPTERREEAERTWKELWHVAELVVRAAR